MNHPVLKICSLVSECICTYALVHACMCACIYCHVCMHLAHMFLHTIYVYNLSMLCCVLSVCCVCVCACACLCVYCAHCTVQCCVMPV